jgi:DNA-binding NarL/FixJ family response regulator
MIRVLIADDHAILRRGLKQILAETEDMTVAGEAENSQQALQLVREAEWDVVLLDISMPDRNGIDTLKLIKKEKPKLAVLMLSMLQAGASGYLTKQSAPAQLVTAIRQVKQGRKYVSPTLAEQLAARLGGGGGDGETASHEALSHREYQTLTLLSSGKTLSEVAAELKLSVKTVSVYRSRLLEKLQLKNNAELTHYAIKNGLVE